MQSKATSVREYLKSLPEDRRHAIEAVRKVILTNLDKQYAEGMGYGMISYTVPHSVFPAGYHCDPNQPVPFAFLASQKNYMALYLMCVYGDQAHAEWFTKAWAKTGKKLDMGKSCVRFKRLEDLPLDVIGEAIRRVPAKKFLERYLAEVSQRKPAGARPAARQRAAKRVTRQAASAAKPAARSQKKSPPKPSKARAARR